MNEVGAAARDERAAALDRWLTGLFEEAAGPAPDGRVALVATGGLGRRECAPFGDVDILLLHDGVPGISEIASRMWYPIWDARVPLDHAVRTLPEALSVAIDDVRVALSLLDARYVAGDPALVAELRAAGLDQWRRTAGRALVSLRDGVTTRVNTHGELAFLLEGDLKEARGGLRDIQILRAISVLGITDAYRPAVRAAHSHLLDVRDALQTSAGRRIDRILAQERELVAKRLDLRDGDALLRRVSGDARTISYALDDAWRAVDRWRLTPGADTGTTSLAGPVSARSGRTAPLPGPARPVRTPIARDVVAQDGELVLARTAIGSSPEPTLAIRVASASATSGLPIARATLDWLARFGTPMPVPWPASARQAFVTLLGTADRLIPTWEACDRYGLVGRWIPEWNRLRSLPQHHPIHIYTVDRHSVQAVVEAQASVRDVARPDLLLVSALLHDVGKGLPGDDHSSAGAPLAASIAADMGFPPADCAIIHAVVQMHLLLPNIATRRDISDPVTVAQAADVIGDVVILDLLHALCLADSAAAGPTATSPWKTRLIGELAAHVTARLTRGVLPPPGNDVLRSALPDGPLPAVVVHDDEITVAAEDRRGLLGAIAGILALNRLNVIGADTWTDGTQAVVRFAVEPRYGQRIDYDRLEPELRRAAVGDIPLEKIARATAARPKTKATITEPTVTWHTDEATDAVVLELRAADAPGLLYRVASALAACDTDVRAARVATLGGDVVDAFYLVGSWDDESRRAEVTAAVLSAAA